MALDTDTQLAVVSRYTEFLDCLINALESAKDYLRIQGGYLITESFQLLDKLGLGLTLVVGSRLGGLVLPHQFESPALDFRQHRLE